MRWSLPTLLLSVLFGVLFLVASFISYKSRYQLTYSTRNMFPYELNYKTSFYKNIYGNIALILMTLAMVAFFITFDLKYQHGFLVATAIAGGISAILFFVLVFLPLDFIRAHCAVFVTYIVASFCVPASLCIGSYIYYQQIIFASPIPLIVFILSLIMCLVTVALLLNPKLNLNLRMKEEVQADGTVKYVRPKVMTMAFTEWLLFFFLFINEILVFVLIFSL